MEALLYDLRAINPDKNVNRFYKISSGKNLFGEWEVILDYGRRGTQGRRRSHAFSTQEEAQTFMKQKLKTRLAVRKNRGCAYKNKPDSNEYLLKNQAQGRAEGKVCGKKKNFLPKSLAALLS